MLMPLAGPQCNAGRATRRRRATLIVWALSAGVMAPLALVLPPVPVHATTARSAAVPLAPLSSLLLRHAVLLAQTGMPAESVIVIEADDGRTLHLRRGEQLRVVLADTAGTGYVWEIERCDPRLLRAEGQRTWQDPGPPPPPGLQGPVGLVGGPLQVSFLFRAIGLGEGELRLRHWRPWEGARSIDRTLRLRVQVVA